MTGMASLGVRSGMTQSPPSRTRPPMMAVSEPRTRRPIEASVTGGRIASAGTQPHAMCDRGRLVATADAELAKHIADVDAGCALGHVELLADLAVAAPRREKLEHLALAPGQTQAVRRVVGGLDSLEADARAARNRLQAISQWSRPQLHGYGMRFDQRRSA